MPTRQAWRSRLLVFAAFIAFLAASIILGASFAKAQGGPNPAMLVACNQSQFYDASTNGATKLVSGNATQRIYVCGWNIFAAGTANVSFEYGTGTNCGTGTTVITPAWELIAQTGNVDHLPVYGGITPVPVSNDLCINASAGVAVQAIVYYTQF